MVVFQINDLNSKYRLLLPYESFIYPFLITKALYLMFSIIISMHKYVYTIKTWFPLFNITNTIYIYCSLMNIVNSQIT